MEPPRAGWRGARFLGLRNFRFVSHGRRCCSQPNTGLAAPQPMMAAPVRAATARLAPVKLQNQRSSEPSPDRGRPCSLKIERQKCATRLAPLFFEIARRAHPPLRFYFRFFSIFTEAETWEELRANVLEAISVHFEDGPVHPRLVQLHYVKDELIPVEAA